MAPEKPSPRLLDRCKRLWLRTWRRVIVVVSVIAAIVAILAIWGPDGATYEEYQQLRVGMPRAEVEAIIGEGDYWFHYEGDLQVTSWVNKDGTYIRAVFDKANVLVEVSWESGWDPAKEQDQ